MKDIPLIALDLELEQPKTNSQTPDSKLDTEQIIQVGWVVFSVTDEGVNILNEQRHFVNIDVPLSAFIKKLTGISDEDIASGGTLLEAYRALVKDLEKYKTNRVVRQWGGGDMRHFRTELEKDLNEAGLQWRFGQTGFNVKHLYQAYALANGLNTSGGLSKCMARCHLDWKGRGRHDALQDALNTAHFYAFLQNKFKP